MQHYRELLNGAIDGAAALRAEFGPHLDRAVEALSPVEHGILLLATYELKHRAEIPYRVIINEAVELAKSFGGTRASSTSMACSTRSRRNCVRPKSPPRA